MVSATSPYHDISQSTGATEVQFTTREFQQKPPPQKFEFYTELIRNLEVLGGNVILVFVLSIGCYFDGFIPPAEKIHKAYFTSFDNVAPVALCP